MDTTEERNLSPSDDILQMIFGEIRPAKLNILVQTFETCVFSVFFSKASSSYRSKDLLVRLELSSGRLQTVAALQWLAHLFIPQLVPDTFDLGTVTTADGRELEYSITQFVTGTVVLESIWQDLDGDQQAIFMDSVVDAMTRIQCLKLDDEAVQAELSKTAFMSQDANGGTSIQHTLGGPEIGYFRDITTFLAGIIKANNPKSPTSSIQESPSGDRITIASVYEDLGSVHILQSDLEFLQQHSVFSHNDLEPRNLLVRAVNTADGKQLYELAATIDWEMAGFYPFAYEYCLKDSILGTSNLHFSWYTLFKQRTASLLPAHQSSEAFGQAVDLIYRSREKQMTRNVGVLVREKWLERERLVRGSSVRDRWIRRADAGEVGRFTMEDNQKLEEEVLRALGLI